MTALNEKQRNEVQSLLEGYQKIEDALAYGSRPSFESALYVMHMEENESFEVILRWDLAKTALVAMREWTEIELEKRGIEVK